MNRRLAFVATEGWWLLSCWAGLVAAAQAAGFEVTVVTRAGDREDDIRALGVDLVDMDFGRGSLSPSTGLRGLRRLRAAYRGLRPRLAHHVAWQPAVLGSTAAAFADGPAVVNTIAGMGSAFTARGARARFFRCASRPALRWTLRRAHTIVMNPDDAALVESLGARPGRVAVVRGAGVDLRRFAPRPEPAGPVRVAMVSRLLWAKGVGEFVRAAAAIRERRKDILFTLVGAPDPGNPDAVPAERCRAWAAAGVVEWWGHRDDVAEVWARSHIAALPSWYREGLPAALLEAAACGRPIVTTDMPGCREAVRHGENGMLVPIRDAAALAEAIVTLADDPSGRRALGAAGRRRAEAEFADARIQAETLRVYERALAAR